MIQRFTYLGSVTIEHVRDGDREEWNVYPLAPEELPPAPELFMEEPQPTLLAAPLAPVEQKKSVGRNVAAFIRGMWTFLIAIFVEGGTYLLNQFSSLHIPQGYAVIIGAGLQGVIYATKKRVYPDTTL